MSGMCGSQVVLDSLLILFLIVLLDVVAQDGTMSITLMIEMQYTLRVILTIAVLNGLLVS